MFGTSYFVRALVHIFVLFYMEINATKILVARLLMFRYSEKATKFSEISTLLLSYVVPVKSQVEILQSLGAFSEYRNLIRPQAENGRGNCPPPPPFFQPALQKNRTVVCSGVAPERVADEAFLILDMVIPLGSSGMFFVSLTCPFVAACK